MRQSSHWERIQHRVLFRRQISRHAGFGAHNVSGASRSSMVCLISESLSQGLVSRGQHSIASEVLIRCWIDPITNWKLQSLHCQTIATMRFSLSNASETKIFSWHCVDSYCACNNCMQKSAHRRHSLLTDSPGPEYWFRRKVSRAVRICPGTTETRFLSQSPSDLESLQERDQWIE
jgi:hypothetical protein